MLSEILAITYYTHGNLQWCQGWIRTTNATFFIQPKEGFRTKEFWENLKKINGLC